MFSPLIEFTKGDCAKCGANFALEPLFAEIANAILDSLEIPDGAIKHTSGFSVLRDKDSILSPYKDESGKEAVSSWIDDRYHTSFYLRASDFKIDADGYHSGYAQTSTTVTLVYYLNKKRINLSDLSAFELYLSALKKGLVKSVTESLIISGDVSSANIDAINIWTSENRNSEMDSFDEYALGSLNFELTFRL